MCPTQAANPRDAQDHPGHIRASVPEPALTAALSDCLDKYALGYDRAAVLAELIPATAAQQHDHDRARADGLRRQLAQAQASIKALITQVEKLGASTKPADIAYCDRLREQFSHRHDEQTAIEAELHAIEDTQPATDDITLIDELPYAPGLLAHAPTASAKPSPPPSTCKPPTGPTAGKPPSSSPSPTQPPASSPP